MMKHFDSLAIAAAIYLLVQGMGLWVSSAGPAGEQGLIDQVRTGEIQPVIPGERPTSDSVILIMAYVLVSTAILLLLMKYKFGLVIKAFVYLGLAGGLVITLTSLVGDWGLIAALLFFVAGLWKKNDALATNLLLLFALPGIASWIGASPALGSGWALILIIALSVYDVIAVFGTKHMVLLAEGARGELPLMFAVPVGNRVLGLGTGDIALPLVYTVTVLKDYDMTHAVIASLGGLLGMTALFIYILGKKDVVLPALPPITAGLLIGYGLGMLL